MSILGSVYNSDQLNRADETEATDKLLGNGSKINFDDIDLPDRDPEALDFSMPDSLQSDPSRGHFGVVCEDVDKYNEHIFRGRTAVLSRSNPKGSLPLNTKQIDAAFDGGTIMDDPRGITVVDDKLANMYPEVAEAAALEAEMRNLDHCDRTVFVNTVLKREHSKRKLQAVPNVKKANDSGRAVATPLPAGTQVSVTSTPAAATTVASPQGDVMDALVTMLSSHLSQKQVSSQPPEVIKDVLGITGVNDQPSPPLVEIFYHYPHGDLAVYVHSVAMLSDHKGIMLLIDSRWKGSMQYVPSPSLKNEDGTMQVTPVTVASIGISRINVVVTPVRGKLGVLDFYCLYFMPTNNDALASPSSINPSGHDTSRGGKNVMELLRAAGSSNPQELKLP